MEVKPVQLTEFVSEALRQILEGVATAQGVASGGAINPKNRPVNNAVANSPAVADHTGFYSVQNIEFDVVVTATHETEKKVGVGVIAGFVTGGAGGRKESTGESQTRIRFTVPVQFPASKAPKT